MVQNLDVVQTTHDSPLSVLQQKLVQKKCSFLTGGSDAHDRLGRETEAAEGGKRAAWESRPHGYRTVTSHRVQ